MGSDMGGNGVRHEIMQKDSAPVAFVEAMGSDMKSCKKTPPR